MNTSTRLGFQMRRATGAALIAIGAFLALVVTAQVIDRRLTIEQSGPDQYTISWDAFLTQGFGLRVAAGLIMPTWQNVDIPPTTEGERREVVLSAPAPQLFFRLDCTADGNQDGPDDSGNGGPTYGNVYSSDSQLFGGSNTIMIGSGGSGGASPGNSGSAGGAAQIGVF